MTDPNKIRIVFENATGPDTGCFVEVETAKGISVRRGE